MLLARGKCRRWNMGIRTSESPTCLVVRLPVAPPVGMRLRVAGVFRRQSDSVLQSTLRVKHKRCRFAVVEPRDATINLAVLLPLTQPRLYDCFIYWT
jgi:hypothetical protein